MISLAADLWSYPLIGEFLKKLVRRGNIISVRHLVHQTVDLPSHGMVALQHPEEEASARHLQHVIMLSNARRKMYIWTLADYQFLRDNLQVQSAS